MRRQEQDAMSNETSRRNSLVIISFLRELTL
jgi:hypothetical protein